MSKRTRHPDGRRLKGISVLHEDADLLVVDKPPGLLTIATERDRERTAYHILTDYVRKGSARSSNRVFIVHRLDRETSGILVFARSERVKFALQDGWEGVEKRYLAAVHGRLREKAGTIAGYLAENRAHRVYATTDAAKGRFCRTAYRVLKETKTFSLLEVHLLTGRKHQIRVHLADLGHPVVGDDRYGTEKDPHRRLALHAVGLAFTHPVTGRRMSFETRVPAFFRELVGPVPERTGEQDPDRLPAGSIPDPSSGAPAVTAEPPKPGVQTRSASKPYGHTHPGGRPCCRKNG